MSALVGSLTTMRTNRLIDSIRRGQRRKIIPALASTSHTRASAPGRLARKTASWVPRFYGKLGNLRSRCWKLMPVSLLTTDERV